jgi:hypothetical protein
MPTTQISNSKFNPHINTTSILGWNFRSLEDLRALRTTSIRVACLALCKTASSADKTKRRYVKGSWEDQVIDFHLAVAQFEAQSRDRIRCTILCEGQAYFLSKKFSRKSISLTVTLKRERERERERAMRTTKPSHWFLAHSLRQLSYKKVQGSGETTKEPTKYSWTYPQAVCRLGRCQSPRAENVTTLLYNL